MVPEKICGIKVFKLMVNLDQYSRQIYTEDDALQALYLNPALDLTMLDIESVNQFNQASQLLYSGLELKPIVTPESGIDDYHKQNQSKWHMPAEYAEFDIAAWCLEQCENDVQLQRVGQELLMFQERDMLPLLNFLRYFVSVMRENNIVWGVGRGSSVASYVLYVLGVHKIDALFYDLDIHDFLR